MVDPIAFSDSLGRDGGCQGCHPAHRSDGDMAGYPITLAGTNKYADGDNRGANGGCFVGRDVHSNPGKDSDGAETPEHLNAVGQWLANNVSNSPSENTGIWCTNCHNQLGQEMWKTENMDQPGTRCGYDQLAWCLSLAADASPVGVSEAQAIAWLDPKDSNPLGDHPCDLGVRSGSVSLRGRFLVIVRHRHMTATWRRSRCNVSVRQPARPVPLRTGGLFG